MANRRGDLRVLIGTTIHGPMTRDQLAGLVAAGRVAGTDLVSAAGGPWRLVADYLAKGTRTVTEGPDVQSAAEDDAPASSGWYYSRDGVQHGPVPGDRLKALAASGGLAPADLVWREGMPDWSRASTVKGLFTQGAARSAGPPPLPTARAVGPAALVSSPAPASIYRDDSPSLNEEHEVREARAKIPSFSEPREAPETAGTSVSPSAVSATRGPTLGASRGPDLLDVARWLASRAEAAVALVREKYARAASRAKDPRSWRASQTPESVGVPPTETPPGVGSLSRRIPRWAVLAGGCSIPLLVIAWGLVVTGGERGSGHLTKREFIARIDALGNPCRRADLLRVTGEPLRTQTLDGELTGVYWYFRCRDGMVQVVLFNPKVNIGRHNDENLAYISKINDF